MAPESTFVTADINREWAALIFCANVSDVPLYITGYEITIIIIILLISYIYMSSNSKF